MRIGTNTPTVVISDGPARPSLPLRPHWRPLALIYQDRRNGMLHVALRDWDPTVRDFEEVLTEVKAKGITALLARAARLGGN